MSPDELAALNLADGVTVTVQGEGGAVSKVDVPPAGSVQRELFDGNLLAGRLTLVTVPEPEKPKRRTAKAAE